MKKTKNQSFIDLMIVLIITITGIILFSKIDLYEKFHEFTRNWEKWDFDDITLSAFVFSICMIWFSYRRWKETKKEMRKRIQAEEELRNIEIRKNESLKIMAGSIAHKFNNLLMVVLGSLEMVMAYLSQDSPIRNDIERAENAANDAAQLSKLMLTYVGQNFAPFKAVKPSLYYKEIESLLSKYIPDNISIFKNFSDELPEIWCATTQMKQIIENLVVNAVEAIGEQKGTITLTIGLKTCNREFFEQSSLNQDQAEGDYIFFEVSDTGIGMKKDVISKIFDPYFSTKFIGRGLGLAAVYGIVQVHKGTIVVESEPGKGTAIGIYLPVTNPDIDHK